MNSMKQILKEWRQFINEHSVGPEFYPPQFSAMITKLKKLAENNWIFFDTETTGLPERDGSVPEHVQITQLAAIAYQPNGLNSIPTPVPDGQFNIKIILGNATEVELAKQQAAIDAGTYKEIYKDDPQYSIPGLLKMNDYYGGENVPRVDQAKGAQMFNEYITKKY